MLLALAGPVFASTGPSSADAYQAPAIDRYLSIIRRMPFGLPPPPPPPAPPPAATTAAVVDPGKSFLLFEIVRTPAGDLVVGFTDNSAKPPRNLLLGVGEDADGYKVLSADLENETAALEKDGVSFTLKMNSSARTPVAGVPGSPAGGVAQPAVSPGAATMSMAEFASRMAQHNPEATPRKTHGFAGANPPAPNAVSSVDRLRERRELLARQADEERARREQEAQARAQTTTTVEINNRLREANLNLIRKGLKPIGTIELTPEEDAKFVAEGVLPAR